MKVGWLLGALAALPVAGTAQTIDLATARKIDLTHAYNAQTLYWPTSPSAFASRCSRT